jgi:integrase/recombinase XerC
MTTSLDRFAAFLEQAERSPLTIKNYLSDLRAFTTWFEEINDDPFEPAKITSTDLREYKRWMVTHRGFRPNSINRKLATLKSFIQWATEAGLLTDAQALKVPKAEREERVGPRWLDRREQNKLLRVVERADQPRDLALIKLLLNTGLRVQELCALTWRSAHARAHSRCAAGKAASAVRFRSTSRPGARCWRWAIRSAQASAHTSLQDSADH